MSNLQEKKEDYILSLDNSGQLTKIDIIEQNLNAIDFGYELCQKEYEEKLRWIPIEEKLPEKIQKQPYITHVVQVKSTTFAEPLCAYYNHDHCVWLSYPFGNSAKLLTVTHWRYFL